MPRPDVMENVLSRSAFGRTLLDAFHPPSDLRLPSRVYLGHVLGRIEAA